MKLTMKGLKLGVLFLLMEINVSGQILNNIASDKTNIYVNSFDSLRRILVLDTFQTISLVGSRSILQNFPNQIARSEVIKISNDLKKKPRFKLNEVRVEIKDIEIIRDQFKIAILVVGKDGMIGHGRYIFRYQYIPATMSFKLKEIKEGFLL